MFTLQYKFLYINERNSKLATLMVGGFRVKLVTNICSQYDFEI
jgi:hypothetical protein